jgi:PAS domain S-box-containing protein
MRVLFVATDLREADILQQEVRKVAPKLAFEVCSGTAEARGRIDKALAHDVMLLDSSLPDQEQLLLVQHIRAKQLPLPVVVLVAQGGTPSSALVASVDECVTRGPRLGERLAPGLRLAIERYRVVATTTRENERLKRSEARLRLIIEALPAGVVLVDNAGKILAMNLAGAALVGTSGPSDVVGRELYSLADDVGAQQLRDLIERALTGERGKVAFECLGPDGNSRRLQLEALCIQRDANGVGSVLGVLAPATEAAAGAAEDQNVEFAFGEDAGAAASERAALDQALEAMRAEVAQVEAQATAERGRIQQALTELERARATAAEHHAQRAAIEERHREAEARLSELQGRHHEAEVALQNLVARLDVVSEEAAGLRQEKERLAHEAEGLRHELVEQRRLRVALEDRASGADGERERLASQLAASQSSADERTAHLSTELHSLHSALSGAKASEAALKGELEQARAEAAAHAEAVHVEREARSSADTNVARLSAEVERLTAATEQDRARTEKQIAELQHSIVESGQEFERLQTQASTAESAKQGLETEIAQLRVELEAAGRVAGERDALQEAAAKLESARQGLEAEAAQLRAELEAAGRVAGERDALQERAAKLESARQGLESEAAQLRAELEAAGRVAGERDALQQRAAKLESELEAVVKSVAEIAAERDDLHGHARGLEAARDALHARALALEGERDHLGARIPELEGALHEARQAAEAARAHLAETERVSGEQAARLRDVEAGVADLEARRQAAVGRVAELEEKRRNEQGALTAANDKVKEITRELTAAREEIARVNADRVATESELARERETRRAVEDEMTVKAAEAGRMRTELEQQIAGINQTHQTLRAELEGRERMLAEARTAAAAVEGQLASVRGAFDAELEGLRAQLEDAAQREAVLAGELQSLQAERDMRGRQAFDLESSLTRERTARTDLTSRLEVAERELADIRTRSDQRTAEIERDHNEVVARLQKLLEQAAAREFQAAALPRSTPAVPGGRRRPAERLGQLASAMANDLNGVVGEMAEEARRLLADVPESSPLRARAEQSLQAANRAGSLVRHLLRLNERESRAVAGVEASTIVRANEPLLRQLAGQDIDLRFDLAAGLPALECDAEEVVQVLSTLVVTVRGALPLGGTIRVITQDRGRGEGRRRSDKAVVVSVVAEGYGMVAVPTTVCEEVVTRCGGVFSSLVDPNQSSTTLTAALPIDNLNESAPGLSQTA